MLSVVVLFITVFNVDLCSQCCSAYQCSDFKTPSKCDGNVQDPARPRCYWDAGASSCRIATCSDLTAGGQTGCENFDNRCKWNVGAEACENVSSCNAWNGNSACDYKWYNDIQCKSDGNNCRATTCADLGANVISCESAGGSFSCAFNEATGSCIPATSCSAWNDDNQNTGRCIYHFFSDGPCALINDACQKLNCADLSYAQYDCELYEGHNCKWSNGACIEVTSCSGWTTPEKCAYKEFNYTQCVWENNACRSELCSDYNADQDTCESGSYGHIQYCKWENNDCVYVRTECESKSTQTICDNDASCTYLEDACPSDPNSTDAASRVFMPSAVMVLATLLLLVFS